MATFLLDTNVLLRMSDGNATNHLLAGEAVATLLVRQDEVFITAQNIIEVFSKLWKSVNFRVFSIITGAFAFYSALVLWRTFRGFPRPSFCKSRSMSRAIRLLRCS